MAKFDDLEFRITADTAMLRGALADGTAQIQRFANQTDRQFTSMGNRFTQVAGKLRSVFALFGVGFGARVFAGWISEAIEVNKLTEEQAQVIGRARTAVGELQTAFGDLTREMVTKLAPVLETSAKFWKEFLFPSGSQFGSASDALREQVDKQIAEVERLETLLKGQQGWSQNANAFQRFVFGDQADSIAETARQLAAAKTALEDLSTAWRRSMSPDKPTDLGMNRIGSAFERAQSLVGGKLKDANKIDWDWLLPADGLEEVVVKARQMSVDELMKPFPADAVERMFHPIEEKGQETAEFLGMNFRNAFADWISGTDRDFGELLKRMAAQMVTSGIFKAFSSMFAKGSFGASFFGGAFAGGGRPPVGEMSLVGERGPELFIPDVPGRIVSNAQAKAMGSVSITNSVSVTGGGNANEIAAAVSKAVAAQSVRTKAEIAGLMRAGRFP